MEMSKTMKFLKALDKVMTKIDTVMTYIGGIALAFIAIITCVDVFFRYFNTSMNLRGAQEYVEMAMPIMVYAAMVYASHYKRMISVEFIVDKLSKRAALMIEIAMTAIGTVALFIMSYQLFTKTLYYFGGIYTTSYAKIPYGPFYLFVTIAVFLMGVEFLVNTVKSILDLTPGQSCSEASNKEETGNE